MKRLTLFSLIGLGALLLSACTAAIPSWPGLAADANNAYLASGQYVYAVKLSDGSKAWQYPDKAGAQHFYAPPVVTPDGQLLVGSVGTDNGLVSLDPATGQTKWSAPFVATGRWVAAPLVLKDTIYAANDNGTLYALALTTGLVQWSLPLDRSLWGAPVSNGTLVFVTSLDHHLFAVDPAKRSVVWTFDMGGSSSGSPALSSDGTTLFIGSFGKKVFGVDAASGSARWTADVKDWVWGSPSVDGDSVYVGDVSGNVYSMGASNGKNAWPALQPDGPITGSPLVLPNGVLVATEAGTIVAYDRTGAKLWDAAIGGKIYTAPVLSGDQILVASLGADSLLAAVGQDGKILWKFTGK